MTQVINHGAKAKYTGFDWTKRFFQIVIRRYWVIEAQVKEGTADVARNEHLGRGRARYVLPDLLQWQNKRLICNYFEFGYHTRHVHQ